MVILKYFQEIAILWFVFSSDLSIQRSILIMLMSPKLFQAFDDLRFVLISPNGFSLDSL